MQINLVYDSSVDGAPAGFTSAMQYAAEELGALLPAQISVNIEVGWGEIGNDQAVSGNVLGLGGPLDGTYNVSYQQLKGLMWSTGVTPTDRQALASLVTGDPTGGGSFELFPAEEKVLGLLPSESGGLDGQVGFSSGFTYSFDPNNRAVSGDYDFIGIAEHELAHALGRITGLGELSGHYSSLDLFRYAAPFQNEVMPGQQAYFSVDSGQTNLNFYEPTDAADWASGTPPDSFDAFQDQSVLSQVSQTDLTEMDALGFDSTLTHNTFDGTGGGQSFVFSHTPEVNTVRHFVLSGANHDTIQLPAGEFTSMAQLLGHTQSIGGVSAGSSASVIHMGLHDTIVLTNVSPAQIRANPADFKFA